MNFRRIGLVAILLMAVSAFGMGRKEAKNQDPPAAPASGVTGVVEIWEGNFMPMLDKETRDKQIKPGSGLRVRLYEPVKGLPGASVDSVSAKLVAETVCDESGKFTIACKEGKYSLFVEDGAGWYANGWDGDGVQGAVIVEPMKLTEVLVKNTRKATF